MGRLEYCITFHRTHSTGEAAIMIDPTQVIEAFGKKTSSLLVPTHTHSPSPTALPTVIPCPSSKTSLPRNHRTHHHLRLNLLLRHGHRRRKLLRPHRRQGSPQAHPRHRGAHLPSGLLGPLRRLGTHHSSSPPRPCFPRRHERRQHHRHHRR